MISFKIIPFLLLTLLFPLISLAQQTDTKFPNRKLAKAVVIQETTNRTPAKQDNKSTNVWVNAGVGIGTMGISGNIGLSVQLLGPYLITVRRVVGSELLWGDSMWDTSLMFGLATSNDLYFASISAGIGIIGGKRHISGGFFSESVYEDINQDFGFPIESQLALHGPAAGIGLTMFANINSEESFVGVTLSLQLGKMR